MQYTAIIRYNTTPMLAQLAHEDGEHAVPLTMANFKDFVEGNDNVMVDFVSIHGSVPSWRGCRGSDWGLREERGDSKTCVGVLCDGGVLVSPLPPVISTLF